MTSLKRSSPFVLCIWIIGLQVVSFINSFVTRSNLDPWYNNLVKSDLTPPGYVFGIVWTILYILMAYVGWYVWSSSVQNRQIVKPLFMAQLMLNWLWTPLFFHLHAIFLSLVVCIIIGCLVILMMYYARKNIIVYLFLPYAMWITYAIYLNMYIYFYNLS